MGGLPGSLGSDLRFQTAALVPRTSRPRGWSSPVGASFAHLDVATALASLPKQAWTPAYQAGRPRAAETGVLIEPRDGPWVAEATGLIPLTGWPPGTRLILRTERPHRRAAAHHRRRRPARDRVSHQHRPRRSALPARQPGTAAPPACRGRGPDPGSVTASTRGRQTT